MIELKTYHKSTLQEFISSGKYQSYEFLPITKHRAESQIKNPKANEEQTLLILAFEGEKLAGYLGILPDSFLIDDTIFRYGWLSTLFVSSNFRGKRIAQQLLDKAFEDYNGNIAITEFTPEAESLYNKIKVFKYIQPKIGKRFYLKTDFQEMIPAKKPKLAYLKPLFKVADVGFNSVLSIKNSFIKKPDFRFEILDKIDSESESFKSTFKTNRNSEEMNWFIKNPWILEGKQEDERYLFSSFSNEFKYFWLKIFNKENLIETCALLLLRDGNLKIPYYFSNSGHKNFVELLTYFSEKHRVKFITSYQTFINKEIEKQKSFPKIYSRNFERRYMFHEKMIEQLPKNFKPNFQDGDGDCALT